MFEDNSVWFPGRGEKEDDGIGRAHTFRFCETLDALVRSVAESDWQRSDYWSDTVLRVRWEGQLYEYRVTVESVPEFSYEGKELS